VKKFTAPLRLTWDWGWPPIAHPGAPPRRPPPELARAIGAAIVRARVLLLEVGYPDPAALFDGELAAALAGFAGSLSLVLSPLAAAALVDTEPWKALGAEEVWLDATPGGAVIPAGLQAWPAVRFYLTSGNLDAVAARIELAVTGGATAISLPNLPLFGEVLRAAESVTPSAGQLRSFAARIAVAIATRPGIDLRVHHYGLWQALRSEGVQPQAEESPGAGCQAGSALAYIDPTGVLYPCASLPVPLARMGEGEIGAAWSGETLTALREGIARLPAVCADCRVLSSCRGGCRGWAHFLAGSWTATGPDCIRP